MLCSIDHLYFVIVFEGIYFIPFVRSECFCFPVDCVDVAGFTWEDYFTTTKSQPVPARAFRPVGLCLPFYVV